MKKIEELIIEHWLDQGPYGTMAFILGLIYGVTQNFNKTTEEQLTMIREYVELYFKLLELSERKRGLNGQAT